MSDNIIKLNQELIHTELKDLEKNSVEETLNAMLDAEADRLVNAERYARDEDRKGYRAGHYDRSFSTTAGDVNLKMPKLKGVTFETAIIERYRRRETSVEEALIEMYLAGVSVRRVEDITEALWVFPNAKYQRCIVHFYRNVFSVTPNRWKKEVAKMLKAIHAQEDKTAAREKARAVEVKLRSMHLSKAANKVRDSIEETLTFMGFPEEHWMRIRTNNTLERINREIKRRTKVVGTFPVLGPG